MSYHLKKEMVNNHLKIMKWGVQAYLSGANHIKIGFVTRNNTKNNSDHLLVGLYDINLDEIIAFTNFSKLKG